MSYRGNYGGPTALPVRVDKLSSEMEAVDALPPAVLHAIHEAPVNLCAGAILRGRWRDWAEAIAAIRAASETAAATAPLHVAASATIMRYDEASRHGKRTAPR